MLQRDFDKIFLVIDIYLYINIYLYMYIWRNRYLEQKGMKAVVMMKVFALSSVGMNRQRLSFEKK